MPTRIATSLPYTELEVADGNFDKTRSPIDRVIIHTMVGTWQCAAARFDDPASKVSAHYGVKLDGTYIHWLEETYTAFHAGDYPMNQRSIGIEHEDNGDYNGVRPDALYKASGALVKDICTFYGIPIDRSHILKHSEVSDAPTGCPDALDIDRIVQEAAQLSVPMATISQADLDALRADRDTNWNIILAVAAALDYAFDANDKEKSKNEMVNMILDLKQKANKPPEVITQIVSVPIPESTDATSTPTPPAPEKTTRPDTPQLPPKPPVPQWLIDVYNLFLGLLKGVRK